MARDRHVSAVPAGWVFRWSPLGTPWFPKLCALGLTTAVFALLLAAVRVEIRTPDRWVPQRASVIHVGGDPAGLALTRQAQEGGPFPSRFDPAEWTGFAPLENALEELTKWRPAEYHPQPRALPADAGSSGPEPLAEPGALVFPERAPPPSAGTPAAAVRLVPVLDALAGIRQDELPDPLPGFDGVELKPAAGSRLFLARLRPDGSVIDAVPLAGADKDNEEHIRRLGGWLRSLRFAATEAEETRWITVGVRFINQAENHADQPE